MSTKTNGFIQKDEVGKKITFDNVLLYSDDKTVEIGQPYLSNVKVTAKIIDEVKGTKLSILRFRRRKHSMRKQGHRAKYTKIEIDKIKLELIDASGNLIDTPFNPSERTVTLK